MKYVVNRRFEVDTSLTGFSFTAGHVATSVTMTNQTIAGAGREFLSRLMTPTLTTAIGDVFQSVFVSNTGTAMNPYRNGRPDILPMSALLGPREHLRDYPCGVELKTSAGSVRGGADLQYGKARLSELAALTFAAGKAKSAPILAVVWDFIDELPTITAVFYSQLDHGDWAELSGHGSVARRSGRRKLADGWILLADEAEYQTRYMQLMGSSSDIQILRFESQTMAA